MTKSSSTEIEAMAACADDEILQIKHTGNVPTTLFHDSFINMHMKWALVLKK